MPKHTPKHTPKHSPPASQSATADNADNSGAQVWVIDGIEERIASVEVDGRGVITVPTWMLPAEAQEGDVFRVTIAHDAAEQARRLELSREQVEQVAVKSKRDPGGDIVL